MAVVIDRTTRGPSVINYTKVRLFRFSSFLNTIVKVVSLNVHRSFFFLHFIIVYTVSFSLLAARRSELFFSVMLWLMVVS